MIDLKIFDRLHNINAKIIPIGIEPTIVKPNKRKVTVIPLNSCGKTEIK